MQLVVNIIPVDHKSYRIEAMSPNFFPHWPFKNAQLNKYMHHHLDMHSLQSYMHMHYNAVEHTLICSHIPYNRCHIINVLCIT